MTARELTQGKAYDCIIDGNYGPEKMTIVPLSINQKKDRQFVIVEARRLYSKAPRFFNMLVPMSFDEIRKEDIDGGPDHELRGHLWNMEIDEHGYLCYEAGDAMLRDFVETELSPPSA